MTLVAAAPISANSLLRTGQPVIGRSPKSVALAIFSLLCQACAQSLAVEPATSCRDELAAAFERLKTVPYRKEVTSDVSDHFVAGDRKTFLGTAEFLPPDRMREITNVTDNGVAGRTQENIRIGERLWSNWRGFFGMWREWDPFLRRAAKPILAEIPVAADAVVECLGRVEFAGSAYLGYRTRLVQSIAVIADRNGTVSDARQREIERKLQQMPQQWRTVFVETATALPAYDLVAEENQLDNPSRKVQYAYPNNIKIDPPLWCRLGLCRSILR
jgi:hypothetical protein